MLQFTRILALIGIASALTLAGCDRNPASSGGGNAGAHSPDDGHDHDHEHEAGDHDDAHPGDADEPGGHDHGAERGLGSVTIGGATLEVTISGAIEPNGEVHADIVQTGGATPAVVRLWIGEESGAGSLKSKADGHDNHFHGHAEVPSQIPAAAALWIEVESASGERTSASLPLP
ncbi:MAG: hypothetical protein KJO43_02805 [Phycisphaerae bacterium]|nr:hypothetical protein [Phycisphaerae bacterium]